MKAFLAVAVILLVIFYLWLHQMIGRPHFQHPEMTPQEKKMVQKAIKLRGDYPIVREGFEGTYIMYHKDGKVRLAKKRRRI